MDGEKTGNWRRVQKLEGRRSNDGKLVGGAFNIYSGFSPPYLLDPIKVPSSTTLSAKCDIFPSARRRARQPNHGKGLNPKFQSTDFTYTYYILRQGTTSPCLT